MSELHEAPTRTFTCALRALHNDNPRKGLPEVATMEVVSVVLAHEAALIRLASEHLPAAHPLCLQSDPGERRTGPRAKPSAKQPRSRSRAPRRVRRRTTMEMGGGRELAGVWTRSGGSERDGELKDRRRSSFTAAATGSIRKRNGRGSSSAALCALCSLSFPFASQWNGGIG